MAVITPEQRRRRSAGAGAPAQAMPATRAMPTPAQAAPAQEPVQTPATVPAQEPAKAAPAQAARAQDTAATTAPETPQRPWEEPTKTTAESTHPSQQALVSAPTTPRAALANKLAEDMREVPEGFDAWDREDQILPRWQIIQPTSKIEGGQQGTFRCNLDGEARKEIRAVIVSFRKGMVLWSQTQGEDPLCKSNDGFRPSEDIADPMCEECHRRVGNRLVPVCQYARWTEDSKPSCRKTYTLICLDLEHDEMPFYLTLHGTSVRPVRALLSKIWTTRKPLFGFSVTIGLDRVTNSKGVFYVLRTSAIVPVPETNIERYRVAHQSLRTLDLQPSYDEEAGGSEAGSDPGDPGAGVPVDDYVGQF